MHKTLSLISALMISLSAVQWVAAGDVDIAYTLTDLGAGRWQYTYDVTNNALILKVEQFTIWFDFGSFDHLTVTTPDPPSANWDELIVQPDPTFGLEGFYDAMTLSTGIDVGQTEQGFSVAFDWLGSGTPGPQAFDVVNPTTQQPVFSGRTFPEPAAICLLAASLLLRRRR
jgi:hypothetical protein